MKQAYETVPSNWQVGFELKPIKLLPLCKRVTKFGRTTEYQLARKKFLGIIPYTKWVCKDDIRWYPMDRIEYYKCSCEEEME